MKRMRFRNLVGCGLFAVGCSVGCGTPTTAVRAPELFHSTTEAGPGVVANSSPAVQAAPLGASMVLDERVIDPLPLPPPPRPPAATVAEPGEHTDEAAGEEPTVRLPEDRRVVAPESTTQTYIVQQGDTLSQIAECFGVGLSELRRENEFAVGRQARHGEALTIPTSATLLCTEPEKAPPPTCAPVTSDERLQLAPGCIHRTRSGESFILLAARAGVPVEHLLEMNGCSSEDLRLGQIIKLCELPRQVSRPVPPFPPVPSSEKAPNASSGAVKPPATLALIEPSLAMPKRPACEIVIRDAPQSASPSKRVVLLANGDADRLFASYVEETRRRRIDVDWTHLTVVFADETGTAITLSSEELTFGETMLGLSDVRKWKKRLKGRKAAERANATADAAALESDIMCSTVAPLASIIHK